MVKLRLEFVGDDVPQREFRLRETDGRYALPRLLITADSRVWLGDTRIAACHVPDGAAGLRAALMDIWGGNGPTGNGTTILSPACWLNGEDVPGPVEVHVTWEVSWFDKSLSDRYMNSAVPDHKEASVTLNFEPAPKAAPPPSQLKTEQGEQGERQHLGHVAIDFGTSYCTAALFEQQYLPPPRPLSPLQAAELRRRVGDLLSRGVAAADARPEFAAFTTEIAASLLPGVSDADRLPRFLQTLAKEPNEDPRLLYAVLLELERRIPDSSDALRPTLAAALADMYQAAWKIPPLDTLKLWDVQLDAAEGAIVESKVTATLTPQLTARIGRGTDEDDESAQESYVYAGLKARLSRTEQRPELSKALGTDVTSDDLIKEALRDIIRRCNDFVAAGPRALGRGELANVVITYPTMATPPVRRKLRDMLAEIGIPRIDNSLDEAIAAAMFTILRDFGSDFDIGLELLRAQSRTIARDERWKQNLLVIDIGGGTTDIALLGLDLRDRTPGRARTVAGHGRYYELVPEVLGSTGRLQLGGELMTLRVFYWIKALLGDLLLERHPGKFTGPLGDIRQLLRTEPGPGVLLTRTEGRLPAFKGGTGTSSSDEFDVLDRVVPTRAAPGYGRPSQAFWLLWRIADQAKLEFCGPRPPEEITLRATEVRRVLQIADYKRAGDSGPDKQEIKNEDLSITLRRTDFEKLVTRDIEEIMHLAYRLASERLASSPDTAEPIDRIILTGQASRAPLVREVLHQVFGEHANDPLPVSWQPKSVSVVEGGFAKLAASLGACWTKTNKGLVASPEGEIDQLTAGANVFAIRADNLFFNLPCSFLRGTQLGVPRDPPEILHIGTEMFQVYPDRDIAVLRSEEFELTGIVAIFREAQGDRPRWADFQWENLAAEQNLQQKAGVWPTRIKAILEVTSSLDLTLLLSLGRPHYQISGNTPAVSVLDAVRAAAGAADPSRQRLWQRSRQAPGTGNAEPRQAFDPARIMVNAYSVNGKHRGMAVFRTAAARESATRDGGAGTGASVAPVMHELFPEQFHLTDRAGKDAVIRAAIGSHLPEPRGEGTQLWSFHYRDDKDGLHHIGDLPVPPREGQLAIRYYASVDELGDLRVHAGEVPFWPAASLADVQDRPGSVYPAPMVSTSDDYEPERDPFNGRH